MDKVSIKSRSRIMSRIRSSGNKTTEIRLRSYLMRSGLAGWKVNPRGILGNPDFVFPIEKVAIFVDGAFWHGSPEFKRFPKSRIDYWKPKIEKNKQRDKNVTNGLRRQGWSVLRFWDYELKDFPLEVIKKIEKRVSQKKCAKDKRHRFK